MANETPSFSTVPTRNPIHAPSPTFAARCSVPPAASSPISAPRNGPSRRPGEPEENADDRADRGSDQRELACADAFRAGEPGEEIDRHGEDRQRAEADQRPQTDVLEAVGPGRDEHAGEDERHARQRRQDRADDADDDQYGSEDVPEVVQIHARALGHLKAPTLPSPSPACGRGGKASSTVASSCVRADAR